MKRGLFAGLCLTLLLSTPAFAARAPGWLREAASAPSGVYAKDVPAVTLLHEAEVTVEPGGRVVTLQRGAVRILKAEGRGAARAEVRYLTDTGKVEEFEAWLVRPSGEVKRYRADDVVDVAAALEDVYNESRAQHLDAAADAEPGGVFGYQWKLTERSIFTQLDWCFQGRNPVVVSRLTLVLPEEWRAEGVTFNHAGVPPQAARRRTTWELRDLPYLPDEPSSPPLSALSPRLAVSYFPPPGVSPAMPTFRSWSDVSVWLAHLAEPQSVPSEALTTKARELAAAGKTEWERVAAIGRFVQGVHYISVQTGVGRGGGFRPHPAGDVFAKGFGDCKGKANLMRTMLKAAGIVSHLVFIFLGDPTYVREEWPSPQQFNHCILAVEMTTPVAGAGVLESRLGPLLLFDPTDDVVPLGDLPELEQGSRALVVAGSRGFLARMPGTPPESNAVEDVSEVTLLGDGSMKAEVKERATGSMAVVCRKELRSLTRVEYGKAIESWVLRGAPGATVSRIEPLDSQPDGSFGLGISYQVARHAQPLPGDLLLVKPSVLPRRSTPVLTAPTRTLPVVLEPHASTHTVTFRLPPGYTVDELPEPLALDVPFGRYRATAEARGQSVRLERLLLVRSSTIPAAEVSSVKSFFEKLRAADDAPIVLRKRGP